jgi:hypothetical protein
MAGRPSRIELRPAYRPLPIAKLRPRQRDGSRGRERGECPAQRRCPVSGAAFLRAEAMGWPGRSEGKDGMACQPYGRGWLARESGEGDNRGCSMNNQYKARDPLKGLDPANMAPGASLKREKSKPQPSRERRVLAAINSGKGLAAATNEVIEAEEIGFDDQHLKALIDQLEAEIETRRNMQRALEAHYKARMLGLQRE